MDLERRLVVGQCPVEVMRGEALLVHATPHVLLVGDGIDHRMLAGRAAFRPERAVDFVRNRSG